MALDRTGDYVGGYAAAGGPAPGGTFEIDLEKIPDLIVGLKEVLDSLDAVSRTVRQLATVNPPGGDPFSSYASGIFGQTAVGGQGALWGEHQKYVESVTSTIENYKLILEGAQAQEGANSSGLRGNE